VIASLFNYLYYMLIARRAGVEILRRRDGAHVRDARHLGAGGHRQLIAAGWRRSSRSAARQRRAAYARRCDDGVDERRSRRSSPSGCCSRSPIRIVLNMADSVPVVMVTISFGIYAVVVVQRGILQGAHRFGAFAASSSIDAVVK